MPSTHSYAGISALPVKTKRNREIKSFADALAFLKEEAETFRIGDEFQLGARTNNLRLKVLDVDDNRQPAEIGIVLYETVIVAYHNDETFTLSTGGHVTLTTKYRMQQFTPWGYIHRSNRSMFINNCYADKHANRFKVAGEGDKLVGEYTPEPKLKRYKADAPHGRLRFLMSYDGFIYSLNDDHDKEMVYPQLQYDEIGRDEDGNYTGDYNGPLPYALVRNTYRLSDLRGTRGIHQGDVPLELLNLHRKMWDMPPIEMVD